MKYIFYLCVTISVLFISCRKDALFTLKDGTYTVTKVKLVSGQCGGFGNQVYEMDGCGQGLEQVEECITGTIEISDSGTVIVPDLRYTEFYQGSELFSVGANMIMLESGQSNINSEDVDIVNLGGLGQKISSKADSQGCDYEITIEK